MIAEQHLEILEAEGILSHVKFGKRIRYYKYNEIPKARVVQAPTASASQPQPSVTSNQKKQQNTHRYITRATQEEIWFWASRYVGVVDEAIKTKRVVEALCVLSAET